MLQTILKAFGLDPEFNQANPFGSGLINDTWKITGTQQEYILQRINKKIFINPADIANNTQLLAGYIGRVAPSYIFAASLAAKNGDYLVQFNGDYFRLSPFIANSHTVDFLTKSDQAYQAAYQFGKFTSLLKNFDATQLKHTIIDFHNLSLRVEQFKSAQKNADKERLQQADSEIRQVESYFIIAEQYELIIKDREIPQRVIHHDAKINNVLFDNDDNGLCIIDLDTIMPGYYISDVGDMMRTYLAEANEEEQEFDKIVIREEFFAAIYAGYMSQMGEILTLKEKELFIYSGKFMIYMQAVRFLTDFLNGDVYYAVSYKAHNLIRAQNQLKLLNDYILAEPDFKKIIAAFDVQTINPAY